MVWPEDIAGELPEPHPEEPASLRSDILDELYDHLLSSLEHEQLTEADADAARKSVLARFGNPATIACRLWWDAMWERIMLQRITLVFVALLCCLSIVMTFMVWQAIENSQQATAALVAQVQKLSERTEAPAKPEDERLKYLDWVPVTVKLEYEDGEAVTDSKFRITVRSKGLYGRDNETNSIHKHPDASGLVEFGFVKPGQLQFWVETPWEEQTELRTDAQPGFPVELTIVCPEEEPSKIPAELAINWPKDISRHDLWVFMTIKQAGRKIEDFTWDKNDPQTWTLLIDPEGKMYQTVLNLSEETRNQITSHVDLLPPTFVIHKLFAEPVENGVRKDISHDVVEDLRRLTMCRFEASLKKPIEYFTLPDSGVQVDNMFVFKLEPPNKQSGGNLSITLRTLLALNLDTRNYGLPVAEPLTLIGPHNWSFSLSDTIAQLLRYQLGKIDAEKNPGDAGKTEAAEVSTESN